MPALAALVNGDYDLLSVWTQPDRPAGRGRKVRHSPVAEWAVEHGLPLEQPLTLRSPETLRRLTEYNAEVVVLAAYGLIVPRAGLEAVPLGWVNIHPSLLPRHRGASPVAAPILAGESATGVTLFQMTPGLDDGPVLAQEPVAILPDETTGELTDRLAQVGAEMLPTTLEAWRRGEIVPSRQDDERATYAPKLTREESLLNWSDPAEVLARQVRAYNPWPAAYTWFSGERLRVLRARSVAGPTGPPGLVSRDGETGYPAVRCGEGTLLLLEVQGAGGKPLDGRDYLRGRRALEGAVLGGQDASAPKSGS